VTVYGEAYEGSCNRCGNCCSFSYWVYGDTEALEQQRLYAARFFPEISFRVYKNESGRDAIRLVALIVVPSIKCRFYLPDIGCGLHGTAFKPGDCREFPSHFPPFVFDAVRFRDCGYRIKK
jgi:Fe-S-cluster containining protein